MTLPLLRSAALEDLDLLVEFAEEAGIGITSMPRNREMLQKKLIDSKHSFLFVLEYQKEVIGTSGIVSRIGIEEPFFAYHLKYETQHSSYLKIEREMPLLHLIRARKKPTEIGTLYLKREFRKKKFGKLLSFSRFLFIAQFRDRFASTVIAELRGVNEDGYSPFWEGIGRHFFNIDFPEADRLRHEHPDCILDLFPDSPIYPILLPNEAQNVLGIPHPHTVPALKLLEKQGFQISSYLDLFDGGPHVFADTDKILAVQQSQEGIIRELRSEIPSEKEALISNTNTDFRATQAPIVIEKQNRVIFHPEVAALLKVDVGDPVRFYAL